MQYNNYQNGNNFQNQNMNNFQNGQTFNQRPGQPVGGPRPVFSIGQTKKIARMRLSGQWHKAARPVLVYSLIYVLPALIMSIFTSIPEYEDFLPLQIASGAFSIYQIIIMGAMSIGLAKLSLNIIREEDYSTNTIFSGFNFFGQSFFTGILVGILTLLWVMLFMLPGMIIAGAGSAMLMMGSITGAPIAILGTLLLLAGTILGAAIAMRYEMSFFLAADDRQLKASHAVAISVRLMKGNVVRMFGLMLSFIGWAILALLPVYLSTIAAVLSSGPVTIAIACIMSLISIAGLSYLMIYIHVSTAVFYSDITGNFRPAAPAQPQGYGFSQQPSGPSAPSVNQGWSGNTAGCAAVNDAGIIRTTVDQVEDNAGTSLESSDSYDTSDPDGGDSSDGDDGGDGDI